MEHLSGQLAWRSDEVIPTVKSLSSAKKAIYIVMVYMCTGCGEDFRSVMHEIAVI